MEEYSDNWWDYLDIGEGVSEPVEVLARFHTHLRNIPGEEEIAAGDFKQGRYGGTALLYEGFPVEELGEEYTELLEDVRDGEGFDYRETAGLYLALGTELDDLEHVRSVLESVESGGATARNLRELGKLTEKTLESKK